MQISSPARPSEFVSKLGQALKRVEAHYVFGQIDATGLKQIGDNPHPYPTDSVFLSSPEALAMATDPAHGGKISPGNIQEAAIGLMAQHLQVVPSLTRETTGKSEFIEPGGQTWDVKSPVSPPAMPGKTWVFDAGHQIVKLRHDFSDGDNVLLDLSRCNQADSQELLALMQGELTAQEKPKVRVFYKTMGQ